MGVPAALEIEFVVGDYLELAIVAGAGAGCVKMKQWWC
jgi:hypothetical protein